MVGLDPYRGFYHTPRYGRPALALDIMEPFRAVISDSVVLLAINSRKISMNDFVVGVTGTALTAPGRRRFIGAFERRLSLETTHPIFGYRLSMRRLLILQARLLIRHLLGELSAYPTICQGKDNSNSMNNERAYIVTYDIVDARRWRRVLK